MFQVLWEAASQIILIIPLTLVIVEIVCVHLSIQKPSLIIVFLIVVSPFVFFLFRYVSVQKLDDLVFPLFQLLLPQD